MRGSGFYTITADGVVLIVKVKPGVTRARGMKIVDAGEGRQALEIALAAPPEDGKANKALCEILAKALGVAKSAVTIKAGHTGRLKIVEALGADAQAVQRLVEA